MAKDCGIHEADKRRRLCLRLLAGFLLLIILALLVVLIMWLVLRPTKPRFYLQDASLLQLNLTAGDFPLLTSVLQVTVSSRNANSRLGVYYDRLDAYLFYRDQQISAAAAALPTGFQAPHDFTVWSPFLSGADVPLFPDLANALRQDQDAGYVLLSVRLDGRLQWKVGSWLSGRYHLKVNCPVYLSLDGGAAALQFQEIAACIVDV